MKVALILLLLATGCASGTSAAEARCDDARATYDRQEAAEDAAAADYAIAEATLKAARRRESEARGAGSGQRGSAMFGMTAQQQAWDDEERIAKSAAKFAFEDATEKFETMSRAAELRVTVVIGERACFTVEEVAKAEALLRTIENNRK